MTTQAQAVAYIVNGQWPVTVGNSTLIAIGDTLVFSADGNNNITQMVRKRSGSADVTFSVVNNSQDYDSSIHTLGVGFESPSSEFVYFNFNFCPDPMDEAVFEAKEFADGSGFGSFINLIGVVIKGVGDNAGGGPKT